MPNDIFSLWIIVMLNCLPGIASAATWVREPSVVNGLSLAGRITTMDNVNIGQCIVECFMDQKCVTEGFSESGKGCQLYDLDLKGHQHMTAQMNTYFYKSVCDNQSYTYIRRLNTCIKRNATEVTFEETRADCQADGGELLMVKNNDVRLYLKDIMLAVTDTFAYWLGATQDPGNNSIWYWVDGTQMAIETGWIFWAENNPNSNPASKYGDVVSMTRANIRRPVFCAKCHRKLYIHLKFRVPVK